MSNVIDLAARRSERPDIHVFTNPPWGDDEGVTFIDINWGPALIYDVVDGWVLCFCGEDDISNEWYDTGEMAPPHIHEVVEHCHRYQEGPWGEFVSWVQSGPEELKRALSASRAYLKQRTRRQDPKTGRLFFPRPEDYINLDGPDFL